MLTKIDKITASVNDMLSKIEHISLCFSIMFQICDDMEDFEKDFQINKTNSHLKIMSSQTILTLYKICRNDFLRFTDNLCFKYPKVMTTRRKRPL